jgi:hypothetical protein
MSRALAEVRALGYAEARRHVEATGAWAAGDYWADAEAFGESIDGQPTPEVQRACRQYLDELAAVAALDPFYLAAILWERFPEGEAARVLTRGAGVADYRRCAGPGNGVTCDRGVKSLATDYCDLCAHARANAQKRAAKHRQAPEVPPCCTPRKQCPQHRQSAKAQRDYKRAWATGSRGERYIALLFEVMGQDDAGYGAWLIEDAANPRPLDAGSTSIYVPPLDRKADREAARWLARHGGEKVSLLVEGA